LSRPGKRPRRTTARAIRPKPYTRSAAGAHPEDGYFASADVLASTPRSTEAAHGHDHDADGTEIFYKDWGSGQPVVFSHGWPLSADDRDAQMLFFLRHGYRVIAHDRRGHGRSTQTSDGHDMDHYADDLAAVAAHLDLQGAIHVGHSTGGGEVVHYIARHGESRVAKAVLISSVPPLMVQTDANPKLMPNATLKTYRGFPHGMPTTQAETINAGLLAFIQS
jgi:alpha-beta hydrolase superfamily lysophospholipase